MFRFIIDQQPTFQNRRHRRRPHGLSRPACPASTMRRFLGRPVLRLPEGAYFIANLGILFPSILVTWVEEHLHIISVRLCSKRRVEMH